MLEITAYKIFWESTVDKEKMLKSLNQCAGSIEGFDEIGTVLGEASLQMVYQFVRHLCGDSRDPHAFSHSHPIDIRVAQAEETGRSFPNFVDPLSPK